MKNGKHPERPLENRVNESISLETDSHSWSERLIVKEVLSIGLCSSNQRTFSSSISGGQRSTSTLTRLSEANLIDLRTSLVIPYRREREREGKRERCPHALNVSADGCKFEFVLANYLSLLL